MAETIRFISHKHEAPPLAAQWSGWLIVGLTILAPLLGGSTESRAQAALMLLTSLLFLCAPPRHSLGRVAHILFGAVAVLALVAFLPANWFPQSDWRQAFARFGIPLPGTLTPQPWLTLESSFLLWFGLAWTYYLLAIDWPVGFREKAWDAFCFGILCLAAIVTISYALKMRLPFWPATREFGFFPNRNQTANVLALGGIMMYANAFQHLQRGRESGWLWLVGLGLVCWALILNFSRAGIVLFFCGALAWHLWWLIRAREDLNPALTIWPLAVLLALLVVAGGETWLRFQRESADTFSAQGARFLIYRDTWQLLKHSPLSGIGLGNFRAIFSSQRQFYVAPKEAIHPESDWLWCGVEMGILAPLLVLCLAGWWLRRCFPFERGSWRRMRVAAMICGCAFAVHSFFDVSAHRLGALWPVLFLASTALYPQIGFSPSRIVPRTFRWFGILFGALGIWWFASMLGADVFPTSANLDRYWKEIATAADHEDYQKMIESATEGLRIAPLSWELYFKRGFAEAASYRSRRETQRDFDAARYLLPNWGDLYLKEGQTWLAVGEPILAFQVWEEAMHRLSSEAPHFYGELFGSVQADPDLR